jgi:hypothetical protein
MAMAERRVAAGRSAVQAQRDTAGVAADRLRVRGEVAGAVASRAADEVASPAPARQGMSSVVPGMAEPLAKASQGYADAGARSCYSLESDQRGAMWGDQPLPLVVVVDSGTAVGTRGARVRSGATGTEMRAAWTRSGKDSVVITLQRIGLTGTVALGPDAGGRAGTATSGAIAVSNELAVRERADAAGARAKSARRAAPPPSAAAGAAPNAAPSAAPGAAPSAVPVPVTLRPVACPTR